MSQVCKTCGGRDRKLYACGGCRREFYCGRVCQIRDWPTHKPSCASAPVGVLIALPEATQSCSRAKRCTRRFWDRPGPHSDFQALQEIAGFGLQAVARYSTFKGTSERMLFKTIPSADPERMCGDLLTRNLAHPNVMYSCGAHFDAAGEHVALVMDYLGDTLNTLQQRQAHSRATDSEDFLLIAYQLVRGMRYVYSRLVSHDDFHGGNVFVSNGVDALDRGTTFPRAVIGDFGEATLHDVDLSAYRGAANESDDLVALRRMLADTAMLIPPSARQPADVAILEDFERARKSSRSVVAALGEMLNHRSFSSDMEDLPGVSVREFVETALPCAEPIWATPTESLLGSQAMHPQIRRDESHREWHRQAARELTRAIFRANSLPGVAFLAMEFLDRIYNNEEDEAPPASIEGVATALLDLARARARDGVRPQIDLAVLRWAMRALDGNVYGPSVYSFLTNAASRRLKAPSIVAAVAMCCAPEIREKMLPSEIAAMALIPAVPALVKTAFRPADSMLCWTVHAADVASLTMPLLWDVFVALEVKE